MAIDILSMLNPGGGGLAAAPAAPEDPLMARLRELLAEQASPLPVVEPTPPEKISPLGKIMFALGAGARAGAGSNPNLAAFEELRQRRDRSARSDTARRQAQSDRREAAKRQGGAMEAGMIRQDMLEGRRVAREDEREASRRKFETDLAETTFQRQHAAALERLKVQFGYETDMANLMNKARAAKGDTRAQESGDATAAGLENALVGGLDQGGNVQPSMIDRLAGIEDPRERLKSVRDSIEAVGLQLSRPADEDSLERITLLSSKLLERLQDLEDRTINEIQDRMASTATRQLEGKREVEQRGEEIFQRVMGQSPFVGPKY